MTFNAETTIYSVTSLTHELKNLVEGKYRFIQVRGEISNLKRPYSGHAYFTLKDTTAQLKGVLFKGQARYLTQDIEDGQQVVCHGRISIYEPRGDYQLIVDSVDFQGSGQLQQRYEKLKQQLQSEGLFEQERKQQIPPFPQEIVLITSPSGAAVHDFLKIWRKRAFPTHIRIFPVRVQGTEAAAEIAHALLTINRKFPQSDCIVLCRGGGSIEDLWAFNEELLARAIHRSKIPIVSAIGHEVDFTISDFCADLRAATPTAASEMIIPDGHALREQLQHSRRFLKKILLTSIADYQYRVTQNRRLLGDMDFLFTNSSLRLDHAASRLCTLMEKRIANAEIRCNTLVTRLQNNSPMATLQMQEQRLQFSKEKLSYLIKNLLQDKETFFRQQAVLLDAVSPLATMSRGYSIARKIDRKSNKKTLLRESGQLQKNDRVEIQLHKGKVECEVTGIVGE